MELRDLIYLGACQLLADEVRRNGFGLAKNKIPEALELSKQVWARAVADKDLS